MHMANGDDGPASLVLRHLHKIDARLQRMEAEMVDCPAPRRAE
jgi:hypothetical protein